MPDSLGIEDVGFWVKLRAVTQLMSGWILMILVFSVLTGSWGQLYLI